MKKIIAVALIALAVAGCSSVNDLDNPDKVKLINVDGVRCVLAISSGGSSVAIDCDF